MEEKWNLNHSQKFVVWKNELGDVVEGVNNNLVEEGVVVARPRTVIASVFDIERAFEDDTSAASVFLEEYYPGSSVMADPRLESRHREDNPYS